MSLYQTLSLGISLDGSFIHTHTLYLSLFRPLSLSLARSLSLSLVLVVSLLSPTRSLVRAHSLSVSFSVSLELSGCLPVSLLPHPPPTRTHRLLLLAFFVSVCLSTSDIFSVCLREVGGWGRVPFSRNLMSPTPRRKWYLTTGRRFH